MSGPTVGEDGRRTKRLAVPSGEEGAGQRPRSRLRAVRPLMRRRWELQLSSPRRGQEEKLLELPYMLGTVSAFFLMNSIISC